MSEVLSPAGDKESFYRAIESGADAIYMGAPKFNARMKANNFTLEEMGEAVKFAHLKGVKVYVTLNTLVTTGELKEVVNVVGEMLNIGVDAFIVQDLGIVSVLKTVFPSVVLHGSTQMGVHNIRGAKVAKKLGLSRVVLSREVTLDDIRAIKENVDIELEVFVQGALCVAFSGNCYLSSLKCSASGNRGECKQLCRLPYTAKFKGGEKSGYLLSPKDNCNAKYIHELIEMGVESFKIEGRLRRSGYVAKATEMYRAIVDAYFKGDNVDYKVCEEVLRRVFSRGEFTRGYFEGNDIIEPRVNNHIGDVVGKVLSSAKFKDIYKTTIALSLGKMISKGDGLKFFVNGEYVSMGVGNVEHCDNNIIVFGKNHIPNDTIVYKALDYVFENEIKDYSKYRALCLKVKAQNGDRFEVEASCDGHKKVFYGEELSLAKTRAITRDNIVSQLGKVDLKIWRVDFQEIVLDEVFMPLSKLNDVRREIVTYFEGVFAPSYQIKKQEFPRFNPISSSGGRIAIVDSVDDIFALKDRYDRLIFAPTVYSKAIIEKFVEEHTRYFKSMPLLRLPIIALIDDLNVIDDIVMGLKNKVGLYIENIYGLDYLNDGFEVVCGSNMNVTNDYTASMLLALGVKDIVGSQEKWCPRVAGTYKITEGNTVLMTFAHCPYKTLNKSKCDLCRFGGDITLTGGGASYKIRRYKVHRCYYELLDSARTKGSATHEVHDLRG